MIATQLTYTGELEVITCGECQIQHAIPAGLHAKATRDHNVWWYCPMGHHIHYLGDDEATKLRQRLEREQRDATQLRSRLDQQTAATKHAEARANGYKGALVQAKTRAAKGVCPVAGCKRHFVDDSVFGIDHDRCPLCGAPAPAERFHSTPVPAEPDTATRAVEVRRCSAQCGWRGDAT